MSADRREIRPEHLLRAALGDRVVGDVLRALDVAPQDLRTTLERRCLARIEVVDEELLHTVGIDLDTVLVSLNRPAEADAAWDLARFSPSARRVLLLAVGETATLGAASIGPGHLLLGLRRSRDGVVAGTFAQHPVPVGRLREVVRRWGRRAG